MTKRAPVNQKTFSAWLALLPLFILVVGFTFFPLIKILFIGLGKTVQPFQINSFALLVKDANFRQALKNTLILCLGVVPASLVIGFFLAWAVSEVRLLRPVWRTIYLLPLASGFVGLTILMQGLFQFRQGLMNEGLKLGGWTVRHWLQIPTAANAAFMVTVLIQGLGLSFVIFVAKIRTLQHRQAIYQLAAIDGASPRQQLRYVTLPALKTTFWVVLLVELMFVLQLFDQAYIFFNHHSVSQHLGFTLTYYVYQIFWQQHNYQLAVAAALVLMGLMVLGMIIPLCCLKKHPRNFTPQIKAL